MEDYTQFENNEILNFYNLVYYVEREIKSKSSKGFNIQDKDFKHFCVENSISINVSNSHVIKQKKKHKNINSIYFTNTKKSQIASVLIHFRNAICHAQIKIEDDYLLFEDIYNKNITMIASLDRKLFEKFISSMKATRK